MKQIAHTPTTSQTPLPQIRFYPCASLPRCRLWASTSPTGKPRIASQLQSMSRLAGQPKETLRTGERCYRLRRPELGGGGRRESYVSYQAPQSLPRSGEKRRMNELKQVGGWALTELGFLFCFSGSLPGPSPVCLSGLLASLRALTLSVSLSLSPSLPSSLSPPLSLPSLLSPPPPPFPRPLPLCWFWIHHCLVLSTRLCWGSEYSAAKVCICGCFRKD